ncbi:hypothetical protein J3A83DRAFT_4367556 [Scleroderma citrinum]
MSLTSLLLGAKDSGKKKLKLDKDLDAVFKAQACEDRPTSAAELPNEKKRKSKKHDEEPEGKRSKSLKLMNTVDPKQDNSDIKAAQAGSSKPANKDPSDLDSDGGDDPSNLVHETLRVNGSMHYKAEGKRQKYAPPGETQEQKDARTIFIGNLPSEVAKTRSLQKQLRRHILASLPMAKVESVRFRSIPFQTPTSKLPSDADTSDDKKKVRQHERDRASSWREVNSKDDTPKVEEKKFLTPNQKKKIAFINHDIHSGADSVHAYIVFAYPKSPESRPANLPPPPPVMDPFEAARLAVEKCNGTIFMDRMLRVDAVGGTTSTNIASTSSAVGDPKLTVFVGNLDFASKEDDLRVFFEGLINVERGPPVDASGSDGAKPEAWVTRVRMIRDKDTQLGKGIAYVQFADRTCVDEVLALGPEKLKFAKRKLRVQRCKNIQSGSVSWNTPASKPPPRAVNSSTPIVPKGDPFLGEKLMNLSKEERKQVKAADADRRARRIAKKKARMTLAKQGVPAKGKDRERVRKSATVRKTSGSSSQMASKGRIRSQKSVAKRNAKK